MSFIACDTSTIIAFLKNETGDDVVFLHDAIKQRRLLLPPSVIAELLSDSPRKESMTQDALNKKHVLDVILTLPRLEISEGFWERVGNLRAIILKNGKKARLADAMIAQCCIDATVSLITRDNDFRHYVTYAGLVIVP